MSAELEQDNRAINRRPFLSREEAAERRQGTKRKVSEKKGAYGRAKPVVSEDPKEMGRELVALEEKMFEHARNLEFEEAAAVRDRLEKLREQLLLAS
jgi:excinuclease ABC subunit B